MQIQEIQDMLSPVKQKVGASIEKIAQIGAQLTIAIIASIIFNWLHVPVSWLLAPMLIGIIYAVTQEHSQPFPPSFTIIGQAIVALQTALRFSPETLKIATTYALPLLGSIIITGAISLFNGYLLWRWTGIDRMTSFLGSIPGASPSIVAMSEDMGADAIAVALLQYLRLILVAVIIPSIISLFFSAELSVQVVDAIPANINPPLPKLLNLGILIGCGGLGIWGGKKLNLPASLFLGPFLVTLAASLFLPYQISLSPLIFMLGLLLVGISIGLKFDWIAVRQLLKAVLLELALVTLLILICLGVGYGFHLVTQVGLITSILGSTPGGITPIMAMTLQLGGNSGLVLAMQMTRMLLILLISPWFATFLRDNVENSAYRAIE
jgi:hypothetical protein